jgi:hypothetical protein
VSKTTTNADCMHIAFPSTVIWKFAQSEDISSANNVIGDWDVQQPHLFDAQSVCKAVQQAANIYCVEGRGKCQCSVS